MKIWAALLSLAIYYFSCTSLSADFALPPEFDTILAGSETTSLYFLSEPGDFVGQGQEVFLTPADGSFSIGSNFDNGVTVSAPGLITSFSLNFAAPFGELLTPGLYENATRWPFQSDSDPGLSVFGDGNGCNTLTGQFAVLEIEYDMAGSPVAFDAIFEQHCEGGIPALFGRIRVNASNVVPEPSGSVFYLSLLVFVGYKRRQR